MMKNNPESLEKVKALQDRLVIVLMSYIFEMNDEALREEVVEDFTDLLTKDEVYDFTVTCDESNNSVDSIAANELWVDVGVRYSEDEMFIHIPLRLRTEGVNA